MTTTKIIRGVRAIHAYLGADLYKEEHHVHYALKNNRIPGAFRSGDQWLFHPAVYEAEMLKAAERGFVDTTRSPADRMAAEAEEDAA